LNDNEKFDRIGESRGSKFFKISEDYIKHTRGFEKKDAKYAMLAFVLLLSVTAMLGVHSVALLYQGRGIVHFAWHTWYSYFVGVFLALTMVVVPLLITHFRKQRLASLGFDASKKNIIKSLLLTGIFMLFVTLLHLDSILSGNRFSLGDTFALSVFTVILVLSLTFGEQMFYRAYIGPRLYGTFKRKALSVIVTGLLFGIGHIIQFGIGFVTLLGAGVSTYQAVAHMPISILVGLFNFSVFHAIFHWLYAKYNSIWSPVLFHFYFNIMGIGFAM